MKLNILYIVSKAKDDELAIIRKHSEEDKLHLSNQISEKNNKCSINNSYLIYCNICLFSIN
jgi:hypothetical protein